MSGRLTLVGTPIGNLSDFSPRAVAALEECDFIAAEDTRVTLKLLNHFEIKKPLVSYYEQNKRERGAQICDRLLSGENAVLVTDAGMPAISDPGEDLVAECRARGIPVGVVPGPTAVTTALAVSGLPTARFAFEGFLSVNKRSRRERLEELKNEVRTMVFYEAPHKLKTTLDDLFRTFGDRRVSLVRELTKIHEEVLLTTLSDAIAHYAQQPPRGEFVVIVEGKPADEKEAVSAEDAVAYARALMQDEGLSTTAAAKQAAAETGCKKGDIYRALVENEG